MNSLKNKTLTCAWVIYIGLMIYASLMPFDFSLDTDMGNEISRWFVAWPINPNARISGSDVISNLALYIPLGWLLSVRFRIAGSAFLRSLTFSVLACIAVSTGVELIQLPIQSRISSASDLLLNTISGFFGAVAGAAYGKRMWSWIIAWLDRSWNEKPVDIATIVFVGLLIADGLAPYLPTIQLKQVWRNLQQAQFEVAEGMALHPWHWWMVTRIMVYMVLTGLIAAWGGNQQKSLRRWIGSAVMAGALACGLEVAKLLIVSRTLNIANILTSWMGCGAAIIIGKLSIGPMSARSKIELSIAAVLSYVFYLAWTPFSFSWDHGMLARLQISAVKLLPFYHYAMGAELNHARLFIQSVFLVSVLVYLTRVRFGWFESARNGVALAALTGAVLGILAEGGQIFLPSRTPSMTDVYCFAIGGALGAWVPRSPVHCLLSMTCFSHEPTQTHTDKTMLKSG